MVTEPMTPVASRDMMEPSTRVMNVVPWFHSQDESADDRTCRFKSELA